MIGQQLNDLKIIWKDEVVAELKYYLEISIDGIRKAIKITVRRVTLLAQSKAKHFLNTSLKH
jgi:hypothetical protein